MKVTYYDEPKSYPPEKRYDLKNLKESQFVDRMNELIPFYHYIKNKISFLTKDIEEAGLQAHVPTCYKYGLIDVIGTVDFGMIECVDGKNRPYIVNIYAYSPRFEAKLKDSIEWFIDKIGKRIERQNELLNKMKCKIQQTEKAKADNTKNFLALDRYIFDLKK